MGMQPCPQKQDGPSSVAMKLPQGLQLCFQDPPSMGFARQEYWSGLALPSLSTMLKGKYNRKRRFPCVVWMGFPAFPAHIRMRPVSRGNSGRATWVVTHAERPRFPGPPLRTTRGPDPSSLQCSCLENPRDQGAWWAAIYGVAQSQTQLEQLSSSSSSSSIYPN